MVPLRKRDLKRTTKTIGLCEKHLHDNSCINTLRTGDADLRFYITTVQDG